MANPEHLAIFKQGVEAWNQWRDKNRNILPDLSGEDFSGAQLDDVRLSFADLRGTRFHAAQLHRAYFVSSNLTAADFSHTQLVEGHLDRSWLIEANFSHANLQRAKLRLTKLYATNLNRADLRQANLSSATLSSAQLDDTDFSAAILDWNELVNVDISQARGLDAAIYKGPSHVGLRTLIRSQTHLPTEFLEGTGVPTHFLSYIQQPTNKALKYPTCLIGYASADHMFAQKFQHDLQAQGILCQSVNYDRENEPWDVHFKQLHRPLKTYDAFLLIVSEYSSQPAAHQVLNSMVKEAVLKDISARPQENITPTILPLHLNLSHQDLGGSWPRLLRQHKCQSRDFTQWEHPPAYHEALHQLLEKLAGYFQRDTEMKWA